MMLGVSLLLSFLTGALMVAPGLPNAPLSISDAVASTKTNSLVSAVATTIPNVPFFSQFRDIQAVEWQKIGCGIASLAMIIDFYHPDAVSVNTLLKKGIVAGAYAKDAGWKHDGLVLLSRAYGLDGRSYDLSQLEMATAFTQFAEYLKQGPVIASVYYKFDPKSTIPHLVVIDGIEGDHVYYNDPAGVAAKKEISVADFMKGWKKRFIVIKP